MPVSELHIHPCASGVRTLYRGNPNCAKKLMGSVEDVSDWTNKPDVYVAHTLKAATNSKTESTS